VRRWQPWQRSTGPNTAEGKAVCAQNASKGNTRQNARAILRELRELEGAWSSESLRKFRA